MRVQLFRQWDLAASLRSLRFSLWAEQAAISCGSDKYYVLDYNISQSNCVRSERIGVRLVWRSNLVSVSLCQLKNPAVFLLIWSSVKKNLIFVSVCPSAAPCELTSATLGFDLSRTSYVGAWDHLFWFVKRYPTWFCDYICCDAQEFSYLSSSVFSVCWTVLKVPISLRCAQFFFFELSKTKILGRFKENLTSLSLSPSLSLSLSLSLSQMRFV